MKVSRILDAAEELLLAYGYRKVTIDEVAGRAGVGKGTVYLYWTSKRDLFAAVLARSTARLVAAQFAAVRADPAEVRLHRSIRRSFLLTMRSPVVKALATGDHVMLGEVLTRSEAGSHYVLGKVDTTARYLTILYEHGLLAEDPATDPTLFYRLSAAVLGSYLLEAGPPGTDDIPGAELDLEAKADALVTTLRRAFEPATEPSEATLRAAAGELADLYRQWLADLAGYLPQATSFEVEEV
ncbi:helix-turn-helix domain-containing protein [Nonomuraea sp. NPDC049784]|uniref:TetR/AcrR family transcriptional regulator n=1 Tax=Nonomuraea sp. NPDC049784 TaxID=3154361 RepID=UPI00340640CE